MARRDTLGRARTTSTGIAVEKVLVPKGEDVIEAWIEISSALGGRRTVTLLDELPAAIGPGKVGFHADYRGDDWTVVDDGVAFSGTVDPRKRVRTVYAVRGVDDGEATVETLRRSPKIRDVEPLNAASGSATGSTFDYHDG